MRTRTQISLENKLQQRARQRASDMGVSVAEYVRRLVACDVNRSEASADVSCLFDLGSSGDSDVARQKDTMVAEAFDSRREELQHD